MCREELAAKAAAEDMPFFKIIDDVIKELAEFLGRSGPWHQRFLDLQDVFLSMCLELQGIHQVRWLSRAGHVNDPRVGLPRDIPHRKPLRQRGDDFNGGSKDLLTAFLSRHGPGGMRSVIVEGVESDGRPSRFSFDLYEEPLDGYPDEGKHDDCVVTCMALAEGMVQNLDERLGDLKQLGGSMLFGADQWPKG
ncbi:hypothetical protein CLOM_g6431 [Closterium sp. NIES-68]|nr:hypothetical protein CLOM_g6431 [Closterium sp. NIES-68]